MGADLEKTVLADLERDMSLLGTCPLGAIFIEAMFVDKEHTTIQVCLFSIHYLIDLQQDINIICRTIIFKGRTHIQSELNKTISIT